MQPTGRAPPIRHATDRPCRRVPRRDRLDQRPRRERPARARRRGAGDRRRPADRRPRPPRPNLDLASGREPDGQRGLASAPSRRGWPACSAIGRARRARRLRRHGPGRRCDTWPNDVVDRRRAQGGGPAGRDRARGRAAGRGRDRDRDQRQLAARPRCRRRSRAAPPRCRSCTARRSTGSGCWAGCSTRWTRRSRHWSAASRRWNACGRVLARRARGGGRDRRRSGHGTGGRDRRRRVAPARRRCRAGGAERRRGGAGARADRRGAGMSDRLARRPRRVPRRSTPTAATSWPRRRDRAAFDVLYRRYLDRVYGYAFYQLRRPSRRGGRHRAHFLAALRACRSSATRARPSGPGSSGSPTTRSSTPIAAGAAAGPSRCPMARSRRTERRSGRAGARGR